MTTVLVTSVPTVPSRPVRGMVTPTSAGWFRIISGVSPCATCHIISPRFRSMALICPFPGGFTIRQPADGQRSAAALSRRSG